MDYATKIDQFNAVATKRMSEFQNKILRGASTMTKTMDTSAGNTPKDLVLSEDRWKLYHYKPVVENPHPIPVIFFYALVNRYYMIDLQPDRSMVKVFLEQGLDVYVVDWGHPSRGDQYLTMEDYIDGYMDRVVDFVRERSGQDKVTLYGICQGGTFSSIYSSLYPQKVNALAIMVAPIDFRSETGLLNVWSRILPTEKMVATFGNIPGDFMNAGFLLLNPLRLIFQKYLDMVDHLEDEQFVANFVRMEKWIFDSPDQVGAAFHQFIKNMYQENNLVAGKFELGGRKVNLKNITMPVLNVFGEKDHLVPPECSKPFTNLVGSKDKTEFSFPTGHIGLFTSGRSQTQFAPAIANWLVEKCSVEPTAQKKAAGPQKATAGKKKVASRKAPARGKR